MRKILYVGWIGFRNLGDELMWATFRDLSQQYLDSRRYEVIPSMPGVNLKDPAPFDTVVLGGGSLLIPGYLDVVHRAVQYNKQVVIWGSGYDSLQEIQIDSTGKLMTDISSGLQNYRQMLSEICSHSSYFGVRGPVTFQCLQQLGLGNQIHISNDPGLLLSPVNFSTDNGSRDERIIGINWGTSNNRIYGKNELQVEDALANACKALIKEGYKLYIYTMWDADAAANKRLYHKINDCQNTTLDLTLHDHQQLLRIMQRFTATINLKLHANVLSACAHVPFICLAYRLKSLDFVHSLELPELLVTTNAALLEQEILVATHHAIANRQLITDKVEAGQRKAIENLQLPFIQKIL